jgi:hypothetical protein
LVFIASPEIFSIHGTAVINGRLEGVKAIRIIPLFLAVWLTGCESESNPYGPSYGVGVIGYEASDKVGRAFKKHVYATPGTRLDEFERMIRETEHETSLDASQPGTNGVWRYDCEGKDTVYYGLFVRETNPPPPEENSPIFVGGEIADPAALSARLKASADPVSAYVFSHFSESGRMAVTNYPASGRDENACRDLLARELTAIVYGPLIYDADRFRDVAIRPYTANVIKLTPPPRLAAQFYASLNHLLLEDAFPQELKKKPHTLWTHHFVAVRYR